MIMDKHTSTVGRYVVSRVKEARQVNSEQFDWCLGETMSTTFEHLV